MENQLYLELEPSTLEVKQEGDEGYFEGFLSVMNTPDQGKDIVLPGAFKASLEAYQKKGQPIPLLWQHDKTQPIGVMYAAEEKQIGDRYGLWGRFKLVLGVQKAKEAHLLLKAKAIKGLSFGYRPLEVDYDAKGHRLLKSLDFREGSLVTFPMHQDAEVLAVKGLMTFDDVLALEESRRNWWQLVEALRASMESAQKTENLTDAQRTEAARAALAAFTEAALTWFEYSISTGEKEAKDVDAWGSERLLRVLESEIKAGRVLSAVNKRDLLEAIRILQELVARAERSESPEPEPAPNPEPQEEESILKSIREDMSAYALMNDMRAWLSGGQ